MQEVHVAVVDDDPRVLTLLERYLTRQGYRVSTAETGSDLDRLMRQDPADVVILDLILPGEDGLEIARTLRAQSDVGIIMLTAKGDVVDRIVGLEVGADDYLAKPFDERELLARLRSVVRRRPSTPARGAASGRSPATEDAEPVRALFEGWQLDLEVPTLIDPEGNDVSLTAAEHRLLSALVRRPKRVLSRDQLLDIVSGRDRHPFDRSIDVLIVALRQKIERQQKPPRIIKTVRGAGYVFAVAVTFEYDAANPAADAAGTTGR